MMFLRKVEDACGSRALCPLALHWLTHLVGREVTRPFPSSRTSPRIFTGSTEHSESMEVPPGLAWYMAYFDHKSSEIFMGSDVRLVPGGTGTKCVWRESNMVELVLLKFMVVVSCNTRQFLCDPSPSSVHQPFGASV